MSAALWFYFWDWDGTQAAAASAAAATALSGGGGHGNDDDFPVNYDELWAIRESYLRSLYTDPLKRQKAMENHALVFDDSAWPDAILKPRRKR
jgi:hypothetical protein